MIAPEDRTVFLCAKINRMKKLLNISPKENNVVITKITTSNQLLTNLLILHVVEQMFMVHIQPSIIVSLTETILKNSQPG